MSSRCWSSSEYRYGYYSPWQSGDVEASGVGRGGGNDGGNWWGGIWGDRLSGRGVGGGNGGGSWGSVGGWA